ncbi:hypothetical protein PVK06_044757 [Gossypium arboreum]|uniref:Uncharacterized protein n=1 Tax=Gossypium arboreum TaxID=29729 RepID=A0ABR0MU23_GOSAR|nr:hypothetical protein PVK06_044757 [Gossypium arboreum]
MEYRNEIALLKEELIQLTVKSSLVVPSENLTLICLVWTRKTYNLDSLRAQLRSIWKTKKKFEILVAVGSTFGGVIRAEIKGEDKSNKNWYSEVDISKDNSEKMGLIDDE